MVPLEIQSDLRDMRHLATPSILCMYKNESLQAGMVFAHIKNVINKISAEILTSERKKLTIRRSRTSFQLGLREFINLGGIFNLQLSKPRTDKRKEIRNDKNDCGLN